MASDIEHAHLSNEPIETKSHHKLQKAHAQCRKPYASKSRVVTYWFYFLIEIKGYPDFFKLFFSSIIVDGIKANNYFLTLNNITITFTCI